MKKILTVVVPAFNADKYLRDNLESFCIEEILSDIDILIVNDGSTDKTEEIAKEFVERYPDTYRLITKENGGHGSGINCGIRNALGKYFKVVDADDWVNGEAFAYLIENLKSKDTDIVYSGFLWAFDMGQEDKSLYQTKAEMTRPFKNVEYGKVYRFDDVADGLYVKMHNLTIKTDILRLNEIVIDENCYYVDTEYITYPIPYVNTICFMEDVVYFYRIGRAGQSVGIEKMQRNECNYDRVIVSLLDFYSMLGKKITCSKEKKQYIARIIARVVAGKIKIMLSFPATQAKKIELMMFDENLRNNYKEIYSCNINRAVSILRKSRFALYYPISKMVQKRYR